MVVVQVIGQTQTGGLHRVQVIIHGEEMIMEQPRHGPVPPVLIRQLLVLVHFQQGSIAIIQRQGLSVLLIYM